MVSTRISGSSSGPEKSWRCDCLADFSAVPRSLMRQVFAFNRICPPAMLARLCDKIENGKIRTDLTRARIRSPGPAVPPLSSEKLNAPQGCPNRTRTQSEHPDFLLPAMPSEFIPCTAVGHYSRQPSRPGRLITSTNTTSTMCPGAG